MFTLTAPNNNCKPSTVTFEIFREDHMCPNCVTEWECNGPHIPEDQMRLTTESGSDKVLELARAQHYYRTLRNAGYTFSDKHARIFW